MSNLIDIANAIDILVSQGRLKEKDSVEKAYLLVSNNKNEFNIDFEFEMDDVKNVLRNKKKYRLDESFEMYKDTKPSEEFKNETQVFENRKNEVKEIYKVLYRMYKNKDFDITTDSASRIYKIIKPIISTSMEKNEVKQVIYDWGAVVSTKINEKEEEKDDEEVVEEVLEEVEQSKLEKDEVQADYDVESVMKNISNMRRFADVNIRILSMKYVSNDDRKFYVEYKKKMEEDKRKLSTLGSSIQREIKQVVEEKKTKKGKKAQKVVEEKEEKKMNKEDQYLQLLLEEGKEEKQAERKIKRKPLKVVSDTERASNYFNWYLANQSSSLSERINKVNNTGLLLNKMEYFLKLPDRSQLFYANSFLIAKEDVTFNFYDNLAKFVKNALNVLSQQQRVSTKKTLIGTEKKFIKDFENDKKDIIEKNKEFEKYESTVEDSIKNILDIELKKTDQISLVESSPRVEERKVSERDLEEHDDDDFLIEIFTPQGTYFVWYSTIENKAEKEEKKKEKPVLGKFYDLKYQLNNIISSRAPAELLQISKTNNKGFLYTSWAVKNPEASTAEHLNKITSLGLSPSLVGPLLRLEDETRNLFYYSIINKFKDQENDNAIYTWTFYGVLAEFLRNTQKKVYIEKLKASVKDIENLEQISAQEAEILGDDIDDLFEEEQKLEVDDGDSENDDVEHLQQDIDKSRYNINTLTAEFLEEKTEYQPGKNLELNFLIMSFLKWLYGNYPSSPQFNAIEIRNVFKDKIGKERLFIGVKTIISKSGEKKQMKIPYVKDMLLLDVLNPEENELVSKARNFINLSTSYDSKSKLYMAFHMEAYKLTEEEELNELLARYEERFKGILKESMSKDFLIEYKNIWKKYNLKIKSVKDISKITLEKLMNLTPYVQRFLKSRTKLLKNPLIIQTGRRNNRKRNLNTKESVASRLLSKMPSNISSTVKECLMWHQTKPYWNLNFRNDIILIAQADGVNKEQMPENMRIFFGDFVYMYYIEDKPYYFYKPSRMYSLLQCHLTYNEKDIVQCRANMDNTITLYTENLSLSIYTGIYNTTSRISDNEDVSLESKIDKDSQSIEKTFRLITKSMYDKECKWWQTKTSSPSMIINRLKQIKLSDTNSLELSKLTNQIRNNAEIILRNVVDEKDITRVVGYIIDYLIRNKEKNISKLVYDYVLNVYTISNLFYPGKIIKNYKSLWKISSNKITQETIDNLLSIPDEYKFIEIYSHPDIEKREILKQIFLDEISREVDSQIAYFYNSFYVDRPKIRAVNGRRIGYVTNADPISVKLGEKLLTIQKGLLFDDDVNCFNDMDEKYKGTYVKVRGLVFNDEGEEEDKIICIRIDKIYDLRNKNYEKDYYQARIKDENGTFIDVIIPKQIVEVVISQISFFDPLMFLKKDMEEYIFYNGEFYNKNYLPDYVCMNEFKGDKNRLVFVKVEVVSPNGKKEEKMLCMDIMKIYELYQEGYKSAFYQTTENISPNVFDDKGRVIGKEAEVSLAIKIPRETVNFVKSHVDKNINKYSFHTESYSFEDMEEHHVFCNYCKKVIDSDDNALKTYEQTIDKDGQVQTMLLLYCSTDCFNNANEKMPKLKENYSYKHNMDKDIRDRIQTNFMLKALEENKIKPNRLSYFGYTSVSDFKYDIMSGKMTLTNFTTIMGENTMSNYKDVLYYVR